MSLINVVHSDSDVINDKRYSSLFDDKKRYVTYSKNIKLKHNKNSEISYVENVWISIELFVLKDLRTIDTKEKIICKDIQLQSKKNDKLIFKVIEYSKDKRIILKAIYNDVKFFVQYEIEKSDPKKTIVNFSEVAIYPQIIFGPKGAMLKNKNNQMFKSVLNKLSNYINNNYLTIKTK